MKIKEAVNRIESTSKSIFAWEREGYIHIAFNTFTILVVPYEAKTMFDCHFVNPHIKLPADVKAQISGIIGKFLRTPVKERFPEKKYRLVVKRKNLFCPKYVSNIITELNGIGFDLSIDEKEARIFSEKELNQIKEREPSLAPAIDAMKEPAEGKDDDND